jgi:hypothetical protein
MHLQKPPKIAVYSPKSKKPWDDAVTLVLTYAEIPYDLVFDIEIMDGLLAKYDWLHLHHEDFTGQYNKLYLAYRDAPWFVAQRERDLSTGRKFGKNDVPANCPQYESSKKSQTTTPLTKCSNNNAPLASFSFRLVLVLWLAGKVLLGSKIDQTKAEPVQKRVV